MGGDSNRNKDHQMHIAARFGIFRHKSKFTYLGRNAGLYKAALSEGLMLEGLRKDILMVEAGPFGPFFVAKLVPNHRVVVVDSSAEICAMIEEIKQGKPLPLSRAAEVCVNINDDGKQRPNRDLQLAERISLACEEMMACGFNPDDFLSRDRSCFQVRDGPWDVYPAESETLDFLGNVPDSYAERFDIAFTSTLFINLRKELPDEELAKVFIGLRNALREPITPDRGILALGSTPAGIHGKRNIVSFMMDAEFNITDIIVDNLLNADGLLRGDYGIISRRSWDFEYLNRTTRRSYNKGTRKGLEGALEGVPILKNAQVESELMPPESLPDFLESTGRVLLAALRAHHPGKDPKTLVYTADKDRLLENLPASRTSFGLLR